MNIPVTDPSQAYLSKNQPLIQAVGQTAYSFPPGIHLPVASHHPDFKLILSF